MRTVGKDIVWMWFVAIVACEGKQGFSSLDTQATDCEEVVEDIVQNDWVEHLGDALDVDGEKGLDLVEGRSEEFDLSEEGADVLGAEYEIGEGEGLEESDVCVSTEDSDGDGLLDCMEALLGTDPLHQDSDRDGIPDGQEIQDGTDPTNPASQGHGTQNTMNA